MKYIIFFLFIFLLNIKTIYSKECSLFAIGGCEILSDESGQTGPTEKADFGEARPSNSSMFSLNPALLNLNSNIGVENIYYRNQYFFSLISSVENIGAGVSLSNHDGTFFGNIARESNDDYKDRALRLRAYRSPKQTLSTALRIFKNGASEGSSNFLLNIGVQGNYNKNTNKLTPGLGLATKLSIFEAAFSRYYDSYEGDNIHPYEKFSVDTYYLGMRFYFFSADYNRIYSRTSFREVVENYSLSLFAWNLIANFGYRKEFSDKLQFNKSLKTFASDINEKSSKFYGLQLKLSNNLLIGVYNNYFLFDEYSASLIILL